MQEIFRKLALMAIMVPLFIAGCATTETMPPSYKKYPEWVYMDGGSSSVGVILCHGRGGNPDWHVVGTLRKNINKKLGYHTLSIQMPGGVKHFKEYTSDFPRAYGRIQAGVDYLRNEKGVKKVYLIGHSMGSRMASAYLSKYPMVGLAGFIGVSMLNNGPPPLDCFWNLSKVSIPILDIYPEYGKFDDATHAQKRKSLISKKYRQIMIPNADHAFKSSEKELSEAVIAWLQKRN
jgi:pimeloyl-ACP methyl ester carboxylesterase